MRMNWLWKLQPYCETTLRTIMSLLALAHPVWVSFSPHSPPCVHSVGDEILEVNGDSLQGLTHQKAIQTFKVNGCCRPFSTWRPLTPELLLSTVAYMPSCKLAILCGVNIERHGDVSLRPAATETRSRDADGADTPAEPQPDALPHPHPPQPLQLPHLQR